MKHSKTLLVRLTTAIVVVVMLLGAWSCKKDEPDKISAVKDRKVIPGMASTKITTVISDSGITRYRIYTDKWDIYDKAPTPYWEFPKGIYFERFNEKLEIDANFRSNYARYDMNRRLYEFKKNVRAVNVKGQMFETDQLFWDMALERIYTDKFIKITESNRITMGVGFESNQLMTKYRILKIQATIAVDEKNSATP